MAIYDRCVICNVEKNPTKAQYCGNKCRRIGKERGEIIQEQKDNVIRDIEKMCPISYDDATTKIAKKYTLTKFQVGSYFKRSIVSAFRAYPSSTRGGGNFILHKPGQEEKAWKMWKQHIDSLDERTLSFVRSLSKRRKRLTPIVIEMWLKQTPIPEISKEVKMGEKTVKDIIAEKGRDYID